MPVVGKAKRAEDDIPTVPRSGRITTDPANVPYAAKRAAGPDPVPPPPPRPSSGPAPFPMQRPAAPAGKAMPTFPPPRKVTIPDPARVPDATPRPRVLQAFAILGCMTVLAVIAITVIIACVVIGLRSGMKRTAAAEPPAVVRAA